MLHVIEAGLKASLPPKLIDELLEAYQEAKENFFSGGLRLSAVEGGRFCEAVLRVLEFVTTGRFTDLNKQIDAERVILDLKNLPAAQHPASVRLHIPRAIRVVYDVRNSRDNAHLADGIDPNLQDATLVTSTLDWVMAELVRLFHKISANEAQKVIEALVTRKVPVVEDFDGFKKVLNPRLPASQYVLVLLYECGRTGASFDEISAWAKPKMRKNLQRTLDQLIHEKAHVHGDQKKYLITKAGMAEVEKRKLHGNAFQ